MTLPKVTVKTLAIYAFLWLLSSSAMACNVPVFRYALERWDADLYYVLVVHGPDGLNESEQSAYDLLRKYSISDYGVINLDVYQYSRNALAESEFAALFPETQSSNDEATIYLLHPLSAEKSGPVWKAPLTDANVHRLLADPDRLKLMNKIASGSSVVMLMLESGNPELDEAAWQRLGKAIEVASEYLALPEGIELHDGTVIGDGYIPTDPDNKLMSSIPLRLGFDLQRIPRTEANIVLTSSLLSIDPKLVESSGEPMVFPVFGRGRFIYPMVGDEITETNVLYVTQYVCGACSCEIKLQNPGMDLPVLMDWEAILYGEEQIASMEQLLPADSINQADLAEHSEKFELSISSRTVMVLILAIGALCLGGVILFVRSRLS